MDKAAIILSRMDSRRLPDKAIKKIGYNTLLEHCIKRTMDSSKYQTILATSNRKIDDPLIDIAEKYKIKYFRGDPFNINLRLIGCIKEYNVSNFARVNGDSPFVFANLIEQGFNHIEGIDFVTNLLPRSFPYGISIEIFNSEFFTNAYKKYSKIIDPEHITGFFYENAMLFNHYNIKNSEEDSKNVMLTIDTKEDLKRIRHIYKENRELFSMSLHKLTILVKKYN